MNQQEINRVEALLRERMNAAQAAGVEMTIDTLRRDGSIRIHDTSVSVWEEHVDERAMRLVLRGLVARLRARGFAVERDPETIKRYPSLADRQWYGRKGGLEFNAETFGRTLKIEFFQNVANVDNPNGGRYDFGKLQRMPRDIRLACLVGMTAATRRLVEFGYTIDPKHDAAASLMGTVCMAAEDRHHDESPLAQFNRGWTGQRFSRDHHGWPDASELRSWSRKDRDGLTIEQGDVRYFRHYTGRVLRGRVFGGINGMWQIYAGDESIGNVNTGELFSCDRPDLEPRCTPEKRHKRLRAELDKALGAEDYRRVATLARVLGEPAREARAA